jgi:hypothetical protein
MSHRTLSLTQGLCAGDLECILLAILIAIDENRMVCGQEAELRIVRFLERLTEYEPSLPSESK